MTEVACPYCGGIGCPTCHYQGVMHEIRADALRKAAAEYARRTKEATEREDIARKEEENSPEWFNGWIKRNSLFG